MPSLEPGATVEVAISGLNPGETAHLMRGSGVGLGPCPAALGSQCLGITSAKLHASVSADASGDALYVLSIPSSVPAGAMMGWQVAAVRGVGGVDSVFSDAIQTVVDPAPACPVYADPTVLPGGDGSAGAPFPSVAYALEYRDPGCDEVLLYPGTYEETLDFDGHDVTVRSIDGPQTTIITSPVGPNTIQFVSGETAELSGVTVRCSAAAVSTTGVFISGSSPWLTDLIIEDCALGVSGLDAGGGLSDSTVSTYTDGIFIDGGTFDVLRNLVTEANRHMVYLVGVDGVVDGNRIHRSYEDTTTAVTLDGGTLTFVNNEVQVVGGDALQLDDTGVSVVAHNTIIAEPGNNTFAAVLLYGYLRDTVVTNNSIESDGGLDLYFTAAAPIFTNNNVFPSIFVGMSDPTGVDGNISVDPQRDVLTGHLLWGSPLIDAGSDVGAYGITWDIDGNDRPLGLGYDIGAVESW